MNTNPPGFVLFVTLGQTDIQIVIGEGTDRRRVSLDKKSQRAFHEACRATRIRWRMLPMEEAYSVGINRDLQAEYDPNDNALAFRGKVYGKSSVELYDDLLDCSGKEIVLCAPLLADACQRIRQLREQKLVGQARDVVAFNSERREGTRFADGEPIEALNLVRKELGNALGIKDTTSRISQCTYIKHGDLYIDTGGQRHLREDVVSTIDRQIGEKAGKLCDACALIANVGGIPDITPIVAESCLYWFGVNRVQRIPPTEERTTEPLKAVLLSPIERLNTRRRVKELLQQGAFDAAAQVAATAQRTVTSSRKTTGWPAWLSDVVEVIEVGKREVAYASRSQTHAILSKLIRIGPAAAVAIRVDSAIRRKQWGWAIRELFTFADTAIRQIIQQELSRRSSSEGCVDWNGNTFRKRGANLHKLGRSFDANYPGEDIVFKAKGREHGRLLEDMLCSKLSPDASRVMKSLRNALEGEPRRVRNLMTHGCHAQRHLIQAKEHLEQQGIWSLAAKPPGFFLGAPGVQKLFALLGMAGIMRLREEIIHAICHDMEQA